MRLSGWIFERFSDDFKLRDTYKVDDGHGNLKGFVERYIGIFEDELDNEVIPYIENFITQVNPLLADDKFMEYISYTLGNPPDIFEDSDIYTFDPKFRRLISLIINIYKVKGTRISYDMLFAFLYLKVRINELPQTRYYYNDPGTIYNGAAYYNAECQFCAEYDILYRSIYDDCTTHTYYTLPADIEVKIDKILKLIQPIDAKLIHKLRDYSSCDDLDPTFISDIHIEGRAVFEYNGSGPHGVSYNDGTAKYNYGAITSTTDLHLTD